MPRPGCSASNGINATGIDAIVHEAGTAKTTLYKIFKSKGDLVEAVLETEGRIWRGWFLAAIEARRHAARKARLDLPGAEAVVRRASTTTAASSSMPSASTTRTRPGCARSRCGTSPLILGHIAGLARAAGAEQPDFLAHQIGLLMDGAIVAAMVTRDPSVADAAGHGCHRVARRSLRRLRRVAPVADLQRAASVKENLSVA